MSIWILVSILYNKINMNSTDIDIIKRFQNLLKEIFQFDTSDLDFGIYRILNYKRDKINNFIEKELKEKIDSAFEKFKTEKEDNLRNKIKEIKLKK